MSNKRPNLPYAEAPDASFDARFRINVLKDIADLRARVVQAFQGRLVGRYSRATVPAASEKYQKGDIVYNNAPVETGVAGSMYVLLGWICVAEAPQTWKEMRVLTGA